MSDFDFSPKNFKDFCKTNKLKPDDAKDIILNRINQLLGEFEKYEN